METIMEDSKKRTMLVDKRTMFKVFKFLITPIPTNLPAKYFQMIYEAMEQIKREYGSHLRPPTPPENQESDDD